MIDHAGYSAGQGEVGPRCARPPDAARRATTAALAIVEAEQPTERTLDPVCDAASAGLNKAKERSLLAKSAADRAVEQAEQALWSLTAADQPDATQIEVKIREIEKLRGDGRLAFVRAVGDASKLLTQEQRKILTGFAPPAPAPANSMTAPAAGMPGMKKDM